MCNIRYIVKEKEVVVTDCQIKIGNKEFDLLDKPYFVLRNNNTQSVVFSFHYYEVEEETKIISYNPFSIQFGFITGRLLKMELATDSEKPNEDDNRIKLEQWSRFWNEVEKELENSFQISIVEKIKNSFDIVQKLYFNKYQVVEEQCETLN